jgi:hypothetical protein
MVVGMMGVVNVTTELFFRFVFSTLWIIFFANLVWVRFSSRGYAGRQLTERTARHNSKSNSFQPNRSEWRIQVNKELRGLAPPPRQQNKEWKAHFYSVMPSEER